MVDMENQLPAQTLKSNDKDCSSEKQVKVGNYDLIIDDDNFPLLGVVISAVVLIIAVAIGHVKKHIRTYGYTIASVALIIAALGLLQNDAFTKNSQYLHYFLIVWSFVGACIMTSVDGPFDETGNGYFASWGLVIFSGISMGFSNEKLPANVRKVTDGMHFILGLGAASVVVIVSLIPYFDYYHGYYLNGEVIFALIVGILSVLVVVNFVYAKMKNNQQLKQYEVPTLSAFAGLWIIAATLATFRGPFLTTGNGYFASWAGAVCAVKAAMAAKNERAQDES